MSNPWEEINLNDYESHMSLESVYQLQAMNEIMKEQFGSYDIKTIMILGIAGGNGLEHVDSDKFNAVYGVDINKSYLDECVKRYPELEGVFYTICTDLLGDSLQLPNSELLIANLLIEYIGYECFQRVVKEVKPQYVSCIIQINTGDSFVSNSTYLHAFDGLDKVHHQIEVNELIHSMKEIGYREKLMKVRELPNGKKLACINFVS